MNFLNRLRYYFERTLGVIRPNAPQGRGFLALGASVEGVGKNIYLAERSIVRSGTILDCEGEGARIVVGERASVGPLAELRTQPNGCIEIGQGSSVKSFCVIYGAGGVRIGNNVRVSSHTMVLASGHAFDNPDVPFLEQEVQPKGITIGDEVWIGAGAIILDGVTIGSGAVVGAGSVVASNIPQKAIAVGVPAKVIRMRGEKK